MKNNNRIYTILSIFILVSLFFVIFFIWPLFNGIKKNSSDLISAKKSMVALISQISETQNFSNNYADYKTNLDKIDQMFVDPANPVDFIRFLENTALKNQITSQISLPSSSKSSKNIAQNFIIFQFSSKGSFSEMLAFVKQIESGPYLIEIENLTIQNLGEPLKTVDAAFTIKAFIKTN